MKHEIKCNAVVPKSQMRKVTSIEVKLVLETQDEFDRLVKVLGSRASDGSEYKFYEELANLHDKVIIIEVVITKGGE